MPKNPVTDPITDQILTRLWQLANLDPEKTRGSIAGQIKAMSMILAIEGLIPSRQPRSAALPVRPQTSVPPVPEPPPSPLAANAPFANLDRAYNANLNPAGPFALRIPPGIGAMAHGR